MTKKVWITGGAGFVGGHLREAFHRERPDVQLLTTGRDVDMTDPGAVDRTLAEFQPDAVVHLAAIAAPTQAQADPESTWAINFDATRRLGRSILRLRGDRCRLVFVGSAEAYGASFATETDPVRETTPFRPLGVYGATKAAADIALGQIAHEGLDVCRFRVFNHSGRGQSERYVIPRLARQVAAIMRGREAPVIRTGYLGARRDFTHVRDIADAYVSAALHPRPFAPDEAFNLASGRSHEIRFVLDTLIALAGTPIEVVTDASMLRTNEIATVSADVSAVAERLGWKAELGLERIVRDVLDEALAALDGTGAGTDRPANR